MRSTIRERRAVIAMWGCSDKTMWTHQSGYLPLKEIFKNVIVFDPREKRISLGSEAMKKALIDVVAKEKPDYFFFLPDSKEMTLAVLQKINEVSPNTITVAHFGDDDVHYESRSRYYGLYVDCSMVGLGQYTKLYHRDGIALAYPLTDAINTKHFRKMKVPKEYDVSFVGAATPYSRIELMRFLKEKGVVVQIWGKGWEHYPEFKEQYNGVPDLNEYVAIINKTKINLAPCKGQYGQTHMTARPYEISSCKGFALADYNKEFVNHLGKPFTHCMFKSNDQLVKKIKYYLQNEKERERIAGALQKIVVKNHDMATEIHSILTRLPQGERKLPLLKGNYIVLTSNDLKKGKEQITSMLKNASYITFENNRANSQKAYLLARAIELTGKPMSCCESTLTNALLGEVAIFRPLRMLNAGERPEALMELDQIMVTKDYFFNRFDSFKANRVDSIRLETTAFVEIALTDSAFDSKKKKAIKRMNQRAITSSLQMNYLTHLKSLYTRSKFGFMSYLLKIGLASIPNPFLLKTLLQQKKKRA